MATDIKAHITGNVWKILVKPGEEVSEGDTMLIFESMKMEINLEADDDGKVVEIKVEEGQAVNEGDVVLTFEEE